MIKSNASGIKVYEIVSKALSKSIKFNTLVISFCSELYMKSHILSFYLSDHEVENMPRKQLTKILLPCKYFIKCKRSIIQTRLIYKYTCMFW